MQMNVLDILILVVFGLGLVKGAMSGLLRQVVSIVGLFAGLFVAIMLYSALGDWLAPHLGSNVSFGRALAFVLIWIVVPMGLAFLAGLLTRALRVAKLGGLNRLGGALLGGLKYLVFLSCVLNVALRLHWVSESARKDSRLCTPTSAVSVRLFDYCKPHVVRAVERAVSPAPENEVKEQKG